MIGSRENAREVIYIHRSFTQEMINQRGGAMRLVGWGWGDDDKKASIVPIFFLVRVNV